MSYVNQVYVRIVTISHFFLLEFISIETALVLDGRFPDFNGLKGILSLMKNMISPLQKCIIDGSGTPCLIITLK